MGFDTLGDAVLRSMYVVFDLDNGQLGLAQADVNSTATPSITVVDAGPDGIQKALSSGVKGPPASSASASSFPIAGGINGTATFSVSTAKTTIGTATGTDAVPADARVSASSGAASALTVVPQGWGGVAIWGQAVVVAMGVGAGAWLMV